MKYAPDEIWIPVEQGIIDTEYRGYRPEDRPDTIVLGSITYKGNGIGWCWNDESRPKKIISLRRDLTYYEKEKWYRDNLDITNQKNILNILGLFHDMYDVGDAYHEMWNSWVKVDFYEQIVCLEDEEFYLIGIAPAPWDKDDIFGEGNSCAFVCEHYDGTCFWSHGSMKWVRDMREQGKDIYNKIIKEN